MMNSLSFSSLLLVPPSVQQPRSCVGLRTLRSNCLPKCTHGLTSSYVQFRSLNGRRSLACAMSEPEEGVVPVMNFEELVAKDWSFLESDREDCKEDHDKKTRQIIYAGNIVDTSKVMVSMGSTDFVDRLVESSPCQLLFAVHDSLLPLVCIIERHDIVQCWQGELIHVPERWSPFDVVFLYFLPGLPFKLDEILQALASRCAPGARVVISHLQGRQGLEKQRQQHRDIIVSDLPDRISLEKVASDRSFAVKKYVDDPSFYLVVLEFKI